MYLKNTQMKIIRIKIYTRFFLSLTKHILYVNQLTLQKTFVQVNCVFSQNFQVQSTQPFCYQIRFYQEMMSENIFTSKCHLAAYNIFIYFIQIYYIVIISWQTYTIEMIFYWQVPINFDLEYH